MNIADAVIIAIIAVFLLIGLKQGFIRSIYKIFSFFISILLAVRFYPAAAELVMKTALFFRIRESIRDNLIARLAEKAGNSVNELVNGLPVPGFVKDVLIRDSAAAAGSDMQAVEAISEELARFVINVLCFILLYVLIRIGLRLLMFLLSGIAKLPLFRQVDKIGGAAVGAVEGLLTIYVLAAFLMLFNSAPRFEKVFDEIDSSRIASFFYENNFIIDRMFPGS